MFSEPPANQTLTENGDYIVANTPPGAEIVIEVDGTAGGASVALGRYSVTGVFRAITNPTTGDPVILAMGDCFRVMSGATGRIVLRIATAGETTSIKYGWDKVKSRYYS